MRDKIAVLAGALLLNVPLLHAGASKKCSATITACPIIGCSKPNSPLSVTNTTKRTTTVSGTPTKIGFDDLATLQKDVDSKFANGPITVAGATVTSVKNMKAAPRKIILSGLKGKSGTFSEGNYVELIGFIASTTKPPHPNDGESVNCGLTDPASNDFHINITPEKNEDETQGVVVEMIPQNPHRVSNGWSIDKLTKIRAQQFQVRIRGRLFFDDEHLPITDKTSGSNPKRFSVWEIHPLASFEVCPASSCSDTSGWKALEDWTPSN